MKIKLPKNYLDKIVATMFCLLVLLYSHCSYAGFGYLYTDDNSHKWLMMSSTTEAKTITQQIAIEIEQTLNDQQVYGLNIHYLPFELNAT